LLPSRGLLERDVPTFALQENNGDSAGNYHLMDEEFTGGMGIPREITRSWTRDPPEECLFRSAGNCQLRDKESTGGMGLHGNYYPIDEKSTQIQRKRIPPGITSSFTPIQTCKIKMR
jgi:hypothetical protein